jgi:hypothetical protein
LLPMPSTAITVVAPRVAQEQERGSKHTGRGSSTRNRTGTAQPDTQKNERRARAQAQRTRAARTVLSTRAAAGLQACAGGRRRGGPG